MLMISHTLSQTVDPKLQADLERTLAILLSMRTRLNRAIMLGLGETRVVPDAKVFSPRQDKIAMFGTEVDVTRWPKAEYDRWLVAWRFAVRHADLFGTAADFPLGENAEMAARFGPVGVQKLPMIKQSAAPLARGLSAVSAALGKPEPESEGDEKPKEKKPLIGVASIVASVVVALGLGAWYVYARRRSKTEEPVVLTP